VKLDNAASAGSTVVEIRAPDEMALLHRVTSVLFDNDLDVVAARACTLGDHVVDAFYVRDRSTKGKVEDPTRLKEIKTALDEALAAMATGNQNT
jgi:[protein-PII] uridylyltransferase